MLPLTVCLRVRSRKVGKRAGKQARMRDEEMKAEDT